MTAVARRTDQGRPGIEGWHRVAFLGLGLLWLAFPIADLVANAPAWRVAVGVAGALAFAAVYIGFASRRHAADRRRVAIAVAMLVVLAAVLTLAERSSWAMLFAFAACGAGLRLPGRAGLVGVSGCVAAAAAVAGVAEGSVYAVVLGATTLAVGAMMLSFARLIRVNELLREAREELAERAVDAERARFARDLHDILGRDLSLIALKAQLVRRVMDADPETARAEAEDVESVARTALGSVREAVAGYRRPTLAGELAGARRALAAAGIACTVEPAPDAELPADRDTVLAWGVREATTNVIRHSGARSCTIRVEVGDGQARLVVADDGRAEAAGASMSSSGLHGLAERAAEAGGRLDAGPRPDGGYGVELLVPLGDAA